MAQADALAELTTRLRALHKALVDVMRQRYEAEWGAVDGSQLLQLLTRHPDFHWLHELSGFMADVDAIGDKDSVSDEDVRAAYDQARGLIWPAEPEKSAFAATYRTLLQDTPALVMEHASLKLLMDRY